MSSAWPQLDDLIRELGDVCALPEADAEPSLSTATMAVTKATTALARAAQARGRTAEGAMTQALAAIQEARAALQAARVAIVASMARRSSAARAPGSAAEATVQGQVDATCPACGRGLVVRFRAQAAAPVVAFPVACPIARCDGICEVAYPASAVEVEVEVASGER